MAPASKNQSIYAAAIVAVGVIAGSFLVASALDRLTAQVDRATGRLDEIEKAIADAKGALGNLRGAAPAAAPRRGPDPNKRYEIDLAGVPIKGPETAKVTIVEFSDFQ